jgi:hypothetical protein
MRKIKLTLLLLFYVTVMHSQTFTLNDNAPYQSSSSYYDVTFLIEFDMSTSEGKIYFDVSEKGGVQSMEILNHYEFDDSQALPPGSDIYYNGETTPTPSQYWLCNAENNGNTGMEDLRFKVRVFPNQSGNIHLYYRATYVNGSTEIREPAYSTELDQQNWYCIKTVTINNPPDLTNITVEDITVNNGNDVYINESVQIEVTVRETNGMEIDNVDVYYLVNNTPMEDPTDVTEYIEPYGYDTEYQNHTFTDVGMNTVTIILDKVNEIVENDETDNTMSININVLDEVNDIPTISIETGPAENEIVNSPDITFSWLGADTDGYITSYDYYMDGNIESTTVPYHTFTGLTEGVHVFKVRSLDNDGAYSDWVSRNFTVDSNQEPTVSITIPQNGDEYFANQVKIAWEGNDPDGYIVNYHFELDGVEYIENLTSYTFTEVDNGSHTFTVYAIDNDGKNSEIVSVDFTVNVVLDVLVVTDNDDIQSFMNVSPSNYLLCNYEDLHLYDLNSISCLIVKNNTFNKLDDNVKDENNIIIVADEDDTVIFNDNISVDLTEKTLYFDPYSYASSVPYPVPLGMHVDWQIVKNNLFVTSIAELLEPIAGPSITLSLVSKQLSEGDILMAINGLVGFAAGKTLLVSLPLCINFPSIYTCALPAIYALSFIASTFDDAIEFNNFFSYDQEYQHFLTESRLIYPNEGTIDCNVYYRQNAETGELGLITDSPDFCNYIINDNFYDQYFQINSEGLIYHGNLYSAGGETVKGSGKDFSFSEDIDFLINNEGNVLMDVTDNSLEITSGDDNYTIEFNQSNDNKYSDLVIINNVISLEDPECHDFIVSEEYGFSIIDSTELNSYFSPEGNYGLRAKVHCNFNQTGLLQVLIVDEEGNAYVKYKPVLNPEDYLHILDLENNALQNKIVDIMIQFRYNTSIGPLEDTRPDDIIQYQYNVDLQDLSVNTDNIFAEDIHIYPNPVDNFLIIENAPYPKFQVEINTCYGILIQKEYIDNDFSNKIEVNIPSGIYFINLYYKGNKIYTEKFVKM